MIRWRTALASLKEGVELYWGRLIALLLSVIALVAGLGRIEWVSEQIRRLDTGMAETTAFWFALTVVLLAVFTLLSISFALAAYRSPRKLRTQLDGLDRAVRDNIRQAELVVRQLYPHPDEPFFACDRAHYRITLEKNGDARVRKTEWLRAPHEDETAYFWKSNIYVEEDAEPVGNLGELDFEILDRSGQGKVAYLVTENKPRAKKLAYFPLPRIRPTEPEPREMESVLRWPGMLNRLLRRGEETWTWEMSFVGVVPDFTFEFVYHPELRQIGLTPMGAPLPQQPTVAEFVTEDGWPGWRYQVADAPGQGYDHVLRLEMVD